MKSMLIIIIAGLATAGAAYAQVDPTRPMVTGRGNVAVAPAKVIITNQTADKADEAIKLDKFVVTGSVLPVNPARPMVTGRGNVAAMPDRVIVTNQTPDTPADAIRLDKFVVTGSLLKH